MNRVYWRLTGAVLAVCLVSATLLGFTNALTKERIAELAAAHEARLRGEALVGSAQGSDVLFGDPHQVGEFTVFYGTLDGEPVGSVFTVTTPKGYSGDISFIIGVAPDGQALTGIRVSEHAETPGLGANATEVRYGDTDPWFCAQFSGLAPEQVQLRQEGPPGELDALTGATITARAIAERAREAFAAYQAAPTHAAAGETAPKETG